MRLIQTIVSTGTRGVGKTWRTLQMIREYTQSRVGKPGRKVLIFDVNMEYEGIKTIALADVPAYRRQLTPEIRRVLPLTPEGHPISDDEELLNTLYFILENYRSGLLLLEDINTYVVGAIVKDVIRLLVRNRHRDLDLILHYQSLGAILPRLWANTQTIRMHYQTEDINTSSVKSKVQHYELMRVAQLMINHMYIRKLQKRFYLYVSIQNQKIEGPFPLALFKIGVMLYLEENNNVITTRQTRYYTGSVAKLKEEARDKAKMSLLAEYVGKYYGNTISNES